MNSFEGKVAVVIGGASGIGAGICRALVGRGACVDICDLDAAGAEALSLELRAQGGDAEAHQLDVTRDPEIIQVERSIRTRRERIDILFANAGSICLKPFAEATQDDWEWLFDVNFFGCVRIARAFLPGLLAQPGRARLAVTSSVTALRTPEMPGQSLYMATKAAQFGFLRGLQTELRTGNVDISLIFPGAVATKLRERSEARHPGAVRLAVPPSAAGVGYISAIAAGERIIEGIGQGKRFITTHPEEIALIETEQAELVRLLRA